jgi:hypothetical protein
LVGALAGALAGEGGHSEKHSTMKRFGASDRATTLTVAML